MEITVSRVPSTQEAGLNLPTRMAQPEPSAQDRKPQEAAAQPVLRLVIEEGQANGSYVYKTVDRLTGEVIAQIPREDVLRLKHEADYAAGDVIRASI